MKWSFVLLAIGSFHFSSAQQNSTPQGNSPEIPRFYFALPQQPKIMPEAKLIDSLANGNKIYSLPLDNMPCVVPDMSYYHMPVVKPNVIYNIPNPALPLPLGENPVSLSEQMKKFFLEHKVKMK